MAGPRSASGNNPRLVAAGVLERMPGGVVQTLWGLNTKTGTPGGPTCLGEALSPSSPAPPPTRSTTHDLHPPPQVP